MQKIVGKKKSSWFSLLWTLSPGFIPENSSGIGLIIRNEYPKSPNTKNHKFLHKSFGRAHLLGQGNNPRRRFWSTYPRLLRWIKKTMSTNALLSRTMASWTQLFVHCQKCSETNGKEERTMLRWITHMLFSHWTSNDGCGCEFQVKNSWISREFPVNCPWIFREFSVNFPWIFS